LREITSVQDPEDPKSKTYPLGRSISYPIFIGEDLVARNLSPGFEGIIQLSLSGNGIINPGVNDWKKISNNPNNAKKAYEERLAEIHEFNRNDSNSNRLIPGNLVQYTPTVEVSK